MTNWTPTAGDRIARAWYAILKVLTGDASGAGSTWMALRNAAENGSDIQPKTVNNLISDAVKHGYLERKAGMYFLTSLGASTIPTNPPADETTAPSEDNVPSLAPALTLAELDAIEARAAAAIEGPWEVVVHPAIPGESIPEYAAIVPGVAAGLTVEDAAFIAAARTDVPALVAALRQAWATNASLRVGWKVDMRKAREAQAELDHIRSELDVQRYHAEHDPCDVCSHLEAVELGELIDRLTLDVLGRTAERDRARSVAVALECEGEDECAGAAEDGEPR